MANCAAQRIRLRLEERATHSRASIMKNPAKTPSKTLKDLIIQELNQVQAA